MENNRHILVQGRVREIHSQFDTYVLYKTNGDIKSAELHSITFCDAAGNPLSEEAQLENKGKKVVQATAQISNDNKDRNVVKVKVGNNNAIFGVQKAKVSLQTDSAEPPSDDSSDEASFIEEKSEAKVYNLNSINTDEEIRQVSQAVSGLGFKTLKTIVFNRPAEGYTDLDHLRSVNGNTIPRNLKWSNMEEFLAF